MDAVRSVCFGLTMFIGAITLDQYQFDTYKFSEKEQAAFNNEFSSNDQADTDGEVSENE